MVKQRLSRGRDDRTNIPIQHSFSGSSIRVDRTTDSVESGGGPQQAEDGGPWGMEQTREYHGDSLGNRPTVVDWPRHPHRHLTSHQEDRSHALVEKSNEQTMCQNMWTSRDLRDIRSWQSLRWFDRGSTLDRRTATSSEFAANVLTDPELKAEMKNLGTVPDSPKCSRPWYRSGMNGDGAIFKLARFGASSHSGLMHLCRSTAGQCPTLRKIHKQINGQGQRIHVASKDGDDMLNFKVRELGRMNGREPLTKLSQDLSFRKSMVILPEVKPILIDESRSLTQWIGTVTLGIDNRENIGMSLEWSQRLTERMSWAMRWRQWPGDDA